MSNPGELAAGGQEEAVDAETTRRLEAAARALDGEAPQEEMLGHMKKLAAVLAQRKDNLNADMLKVLAQLNKAIEKASNSEYGSKVKDAVGSVAEEERKFRTTVEEGLKKLKEETSKEEMKRIVSQAAELLKTKGRDAFQQAQKLQESFTVVSEKAKLVGLMIRAQEKLESLSLPKELKKEMDKVEAHLDAALKKRVGSQELREHIENLIAAMEVKGQAAAEEVRDGLNKIRKAIDDLKPPETPAGEYKKPKEVTISKKKCNKPFLKPDVSVILAEM